MSDVACEPELPPLEMISGTNSASTTALAISSSKYPIAVAVNISPTNKTASQPRALFDHVETCRCCRYGASSASIPPSFWMSSVASLFGHIEHVIHRHHADQHVLGIHHRQNRHVIFLECRHGGFLIVGGARERSAGFPATPAPTSGSGRRPHCAGARNPPAALSHPRRTVG